MESVNKKLKRLVWCYLRLSVYFQFTKGYLDYFSSTEIVKFTENSCVVVLAHVKLKPSALLSLLENLKIDTFRDEVGLKIGVVDSTNFLWPNGRTFLSSENRLISEDLLVFPKYIRDRTCLLTEKIPSKNPKPLVFKGPIEYEDIVEFINIHCNTYRTTEGTINIAGLHRQDIIHNLFTVSSVSNVKSKDVFKTHQPKSCLIASKAESSECGGTTVQTYESNTYNAENRNKMETCDVIFMPTKEDFFHNILKKSKPVILKGAIKHWAAFQKWTNAYLRDLYGNNSVHVKLTPGGEFEGVERAELWENYSSFQIPPKVLSQLKYPDLVVVRPATANVQFSEFLDFIEKVSQGVEKNVSAYLEYSSIPEHLPDLEKDISELPFIQGLLKRKHLNIWLSDGNTLGKLHFDPYDNLLCQINGRKEVILFEPHANQNLYESHIPEAQLFYNHTKRQFTRKTLLDSTSMVMSPVDIKNVDYERFPLFSDTYPLNCTIDEGDVLFMPAFWWHEVQSYPNKEAGRNLAINFWYEPLLTKEFPCPECKLDINTKYRHLL